MTRLEIAAWLAVAFAAIGVILSAVPVVQSSKRPKLVVELASAERREGLAPASRYHVAFTLRLRNNGKSDARAWRVVVSTQSPASLGLPGFNAPIQAHGVLVAIDHTTGTRTIGWYADNPSDVVPRGESRVLLPLGIAEGANDEVVVADYRVTAARAKERRGRLSVSLGRDGVPHVSLD